MKLPQGAPALIVWAVQARSDRLATRHNGGALEMLEERYARGEIDQDEFEQRRRTSKEGDRVRHPRMLLLGGVLVALGLLGMTTAPAGNGGWPHGAPMMQMMGSTGKNPSQPAAPLITGAMTIEIRASELSFDPDRILVPASEPVNIRLINNGVIFHDLTIPELRLHLNAQPGQQVTGGFTVPPAGEYGFQCTVPGHAANGMTGVLVVRASRPQG